MMEHLKKSDALRYLRREPDKDRMAKVYDHLSTCKKCRDMMVNLVLKYRFDEVFDSWNAFSQTEAHVLAGMDDRRLRVSKKTASPVKKKSRKSSPKTSSRKS